MKFSDWIQSLSFVTQSAHFHAGWAFTLSLGLGFGLCGQSVWWALPLFYLGWVAPKELIYDFLPFGEGHGTPDWRDALWYAIGGAPACAMLWLVSGKI